MAEQQASFQPRLLFATLLLALLPLPALTLYRLQQRTRAIDSAGPWLTSIARLLQYPLPLPHREPVATGDREAHKLKSFAGAMALAEACARVETTGRQRQPAVPLEKLEAAGIGIRMVWSELMDDIPAQNMTASGESV